MYTPSFNSKLTETFQQVIWFSCPEIYSAFPLSVKWNYCSLVPSLAFLYSTSKRLIRHPTTATAIKTVRKMLSVHIIYIPIQLFPVGYFSFRACVLLPGFKWGLSRMNEQLSSFKESTQQPKKHEQEEWFSLLYWKDETHKPTDKLRKGSPFWNKVSLNLFDIPVNNSIRRHAHVLLQEEDNLLFNFCDREQSTFSFFVFNYVLIFIVYWENAERVNTFF